MRKVTVTKVNVAICHLPTYGGVKEVWATMASSILGELPPVGESRDYYIIPAGDVVEFELKMMRNGACVDIYTPRPESRHCGAVAADNARALFGIDLSNSETRRVTAIVHPPPKLRQGWFEHDGKTWHVLDKNNGSGMPYAIVPWFDGRGLIGDGDLKAHKIEIHWYEETK